MAIIAAKLSVEKGGVEGMGMKEVTWEENFYDYIANFPMNNRVRIPR